MFLIFPVSPTLNDLRRFLKLRKSELTDFKWALEAVADNHEEAFEEMEMPPGAWQEVKYIFKNLMENGFGI